jgi:hypothetical protein
MLTVSLGVVLGVVSLIALIAGIVFGVKSAGRYWDVGPVVTVVFSAVILGMCCLVFPITLGCQYSNALYMPQKLVALNATIEQQSAYITTGDATIGNGLEGLEIKREIQQTIRDRNMLIAQMEYRRLSPWYLFKPRTDNL